MHTSRKSRFSTALSAHWMPLSNNVRKVTSENYPTDVVLMDDDPLQISKAIKISRKCLGIVYQNIVVAIGVKLACLVLVALGFANMWLAVFADVGVMIIAVLNAIRALFVKNL